MVKNDALEFLIRLAEKPDHATPVDFELLSNLLDQYPDFDLLRKVFVTVGLKLGARGQNFQNEIDKWERKKEILIPKKPDTEVDNRASFENLSLIERIDRFLKQFTPIHSPQEFKI